LAGRGISSSSFANACASELRTLTFEVSHLTTLKTTLNLITTFACTTFLAAKAFAWSAFAGQEGSDFLDFLGGHLMMLIE
jgi:hypothetical protein